MNFVFRLPRAIAALLMAAVISLGSLIRAQLQMYEPVSAASAAVSGEEKAMASEWFGLHILGVPRGEKAPFNFAYGCKTFRTHRGEWDVSLAGSREEAEKTSAVIQMKQKNGSLLVTCEAVLYKKYPVCEWTLYFKNASAEDTAVLRRIRALDASFDVGSEQSEPRLYYSKGGVNTADAFEPLTCALPEGIPLMFDPGDGRCSNDYMPFFNVNGGDGGLIAAIGWPGVWQAGFTRSADNGVRVTVGQKSIRGALKPGETVRSPLAAVLFYEGGVMKGQNVFRRWINACYYVNNQRQLLAAGSIEHDLMQHATTDNQIATLNTILATGNRVEAFWMDAGWYSGGETWYKGRGSWRPDPVRFPLGLKPLTDLGHAAGLKHVLWFEPESVDPGSDLYDREEYLLILPGRETRLYNFASSEAAAFMARLIDGKIKEFGLDIYRQDCNINPADFWNAGAEVTGEMREGFTENFYVTNFLAFWDYLLENNPGLIIDNCASGGRRICLETVRRSEVLWRCDSCHDAVAEQCHTYGLSYWLPLQGTGTLMLKDLSKAEAPNRDRYTDVYAFRSCLSSTLILSWNFSSFASDRAAFDLYADYVAEYMALRKYFTLDYYPLTPASTSAGRNLAMQFNDPSDGSGVVLAFRREDACKQTVTVRLNGLEDGAAYAVRDVDTGAEQVLSGALLAKKGLTVGIPEKPGAVIVRYSKVP
ncbi:MAG TPA: alpha-galactosidase [Clostridiales bacterium]|nr:MAG: Alpha-galactosidase [Firmicutes bacterium ADurb.Bin262]HOU09265.1 alpha-galactosidase [Clostridiales bacterium]